ncbi:hypothetical protein PsorP6_005638 [Peronosclerospora sorghi]|uniref:Uncharacterized protein n=1 Tax=Peronosclerospora sorghi TaxID=230839 RepID=A0ACC0W6Z2_9STRA|nr:hypothetical protein PsorP6_005638 [Peronosclerospora sorghi]
MAGVEATRRKAYQRKRFLAKSLVCKNEGINHRDNKGVKTKLQELQESYAKASDWKQQTVALTKICKYWDVLHPIMSARACNNPLETSGTVDAAIPDLLGKKRVVQDDDEFGDHIESDQAEEYVCQLQYVLRILLSTKQIGLMT